MRIYENDTVETTDSVSEYLVQLKSVQDTTMVLLNKLDKLLGLSSTPASSKEVINDIKSSTSDHLVLITALLQDEVEEELGSTLDIDDDTEDTDDENVGE